LSQADGFTLAKAGGMAALTGDEDYYSVKIGISFSESKESSSAPSDYLSKTLTIY
jgi:hypothetical protein